MAGIWIVPMNKKWGGNRRKRFYSQTWEIHLSEYLVHAWVDLVTKLQKYTSFAYSWSTIEEPQKTRRCFIYPYRWLDTNWMDQMQTVKVCQPAKISTWNVSRTSPCNVSIRFPKNPIWSSHGRADLVSQSDIPQTS